MVRACESNMDRSSLWTLEPRLRQRARAGLKHPRGRKRHPNKRFACVPYTPAVRSIGALHGWR